VIIFSRDSAAFAFLRKVFSFASKYAAVQRMHLSARNAGNLFPENGLTTKYLSSE
jgi:hypothetical protein